MNDDVLLRFLSNGLLNVGGDDDKLGHLRQTAVDLTGSLERAPVKASRFALVAFDPNVPATDPTIVEVEDALRNRWATYVNTFDGKPVAVFRAVLLDALIGASKENETVAAAFIASARNVLPHMEVGREQEIWTDIVRETEKNVEDRAEREWAPPASIAVPVVKFEPSSKTEIQISSKEVDTSTLRKGLFKAGGPEITTPDRGQSGTGGNPHVPYSDQARWNYEFGTRAAQAVGDAINQGIGGLSIDGVDLPGFSEEVKTSISEYLTKTLQAVSKAAAGLQRRTGLLWWKETLFSPSARMSYRDMSPFDAAVLMAFDMHRQIPTFSPASIAAFLWESVIALPAIEEEEKLPIRELFSKSRNADVLDEFRTETRKLVDAPVGRGPVLGLIAHPQVAPQIDDLTFRDLIGVKPTTMLSLPDWSVWIFRELQAARAIAEASVSKRRTTRKRTSRK